MKAKGIVLPILVLVLGGCAGANVNNQVRDFDVNNENRMLRCVDFISGDKSVNTKLEKYDGWKMVYASEYTTANKTSTSVHMCFEKLIDK